MRTARAIGYRPGWDVLAEAELLHPEPAPDGPRLTLAEAAKEAVAENLDLLAAELGVDAGEEQVERARARRRPLATLGVTGTQIDRDRAESLLSPTGERAGTASVDVRQLIYSDAVNAQVTIEEHRQSRRELDRDTLRLDIVERATTAYLKVLRAKSLVRIERDNLQLTRSNLEMARVRRDVGEAGPSEVYRWESELAGSRRAVIDADARLSVARYQLARLLHRPIEADIRLADADLASSGVLIDARQVERYIRDPWTFELFRDFMVDKGLELSPAIQSLDEAIAAQERAVLAARRSYWAPTATLQGGLRHVFSESGAGSDVRPIPLPSGGFIELPDDTSWELSLNLTYPLNTGGARPAALRQAREELRKLRVQRRGAAEQLELSIRSALQEAGSTFAAIELTAEAAEAARKNLEVISDAYSQGTLSILDLLDAQNAALVADQAAATAIYDHLIANLRAQRAVGRFDFFLGDKKARDWLAELEAYFRDAGIDLDGMGG
jgi:outer membrane protein TolC